MFTNLSRFIPDFHYISAPIDNISNEKYEFHPNSTNTLHFLGFCFLNFSLNKPEHMFARRTSARRLVRLKKNVSTVTSVK